MTADAYRCVETVLAADARDPADWWVAADASEEAGYHRFEEVLTRLVCLCPDDDTPRLRLAHYWQGHGQEERAEFVRVQLELAKSVACEWEKHDGAACPQYNARRPPYRVMVYCPACTREQRLRNRAAALLIRAAERDWAGFVAAGVYLEEARWHRGFVEEIDGTAAQWLTHAAALLRLAPLRRVRLTTRPEVYARDSGENDEGAGFVYSLAGMPVARMELSLRDSPAAVGTVYANDETVRMLLQREWPGIAFEMPGAVSRREPFYVTSSNMVTVPAAEPFEIGERVYLRRADGAATHNARDDFFAGHALAQEENGRLRVLLDMEYRRQHPGAAEILSRGLSAEFLNLGNDPRRTVRPDEAAG